MTDAESAELPKFSEQQQIGLEAAAAFSLWANKQRFLWRDGNQATDFGVDGELELASSTVSGHLVKVQIKGSRDVRFNANGRCSVTVSAATRNYWALMRLPVVAVLVDLEAGEIYWTVPRLPVLDDKASVTFRRESAVSTDGGRFVGSLRELAIHPAQADELDRIPFIVESLERLEQLSWFDLGTRIGIETDGLLAIFHEHVVRLSVLFGRTPGAVLSREIWIRRSWLLEEQLGWTEDDGLLDIIAGEMVLYLRAVYEPLLERIRAVAGTGALCDAHSGLDRWLQSRTDAFRLPPSGRSPFDMRIEPLLDVPAEASYDARLGRILAAMGVSLVDR